MRGYWQGSSILMGALTASAQEASGQEPAAVQATEQQVVGLESLKVIGSRLQGRSAQDSLVPVDIIQGADLQTYGIRDMDSLLSASVPSYNVNRQPISDASTLVRPANLRGLPPDSTLGPGQRQTTATVPRLSIFLGGLAFRTAPMGPTFLSSQPAHSTASKCCATERRPSTARTPSPVS